MGLGQSSNCLYLNVSCGFLKNKGKGIESRWYTGYLISIDREKSTYESKNDQEQSWQIRIKMKDDVSEEIAIIQCTEEAWFALSFFERIQNVDLSKPFTLGVSGSDDYEKMSFCWMKQDGKKIPKAELTHPEKVTIGSKTINDWSAFVGEAAAIMIDINSKTSGPVEDVPAGDKESPVESPEDTLDPVEHPEVDLPF